MTTHQGEMPEGDAIRKAARWNLEIEDGRSPLDCQSNARMTVAVFARDVWLRKKAAELGQRSLARYRSVVDHFIDYLEQGRNMRSAMLGAVTYEVAADYVAHRATTPLMPNGGKKFTRAIRHGASKKTIHCEREILFQMFKEAVKRELLVHNPFANVRVKKPTIHEIRAAHHPLTIDEEMSLLRAARELDTARSDAENPKFHDIVLFLVRTGLREDEMRHLEWSDIDWDENLIHVRQKSVEEVRTIPIPATAFDGLRKRLVGKNPEDHVFADGEDIEAFGVRLNIRETGDLLAMVVGEVDLDNRRITTKRTYQWRPKGTNGVVPMSQTIRGLLSSLAERKTSNFVFAHRDGGSCRVDVLERLKVAQKIAGIKGRLRVHDLRHTLGVRLRRDKKVPLETIMGVLRHADIKETLIYAPYSLEEGRVAMSRLDEPTALPHRPSATVRPPPCQAVGEK